MEASSSAANNWKAVIPTRNDRPELLRELVAKIGPANTVIVHTAGTVQSPDIDGCLNLRYDGPVNIQVWWKMGIEAAGTRYIALVNDDVEMVANFIPIMVGACQKLGKAMARLTGQGITHSGWMFVIDTESGVAPDTDFQWWYGDNDMYRQAERKGGIIDIPVTGIKHHDLGGEYWKHPVFGPMIQADRILYRQKWRVQPPGNLGPTDCTMTVVCTAYRQPNQAHTMIRSLMCQTWQDFDIHMLHDGPDAELEGIFKEYKAELGDRFRYTMTPTRYNDWGHSLREMGIATATGDFILITNADNYYVPTAFATMLQTLTDGDYDGVLCDMIHNYFNYTLFKTSPRKTHADIGAVITKTEHAQKVGWRDKTHSGDGTYIEDLTKIPDFRWAKIPGVLFIHN